MQIWQRASRETGQPGKQARKDRRRTCFFETNLKPAVLSGTPSSVSPGRVRHVCNLQSAGTPNAAVSQLPAREPFLTRRALLSAAVLLPGLSGAWAVAAEAVDTTITHKVYLDISLAPRSFKPAEERGLGDRSVVPLEDAAPLGRVVLGLYGRAAPGTVSNFLRLVDSGALADTTFSRVLPGEYVQAGGQGAFRLGGVEAAGAELQPNPDLSSASAFRLTHTRPGTLSLSLAESDEDPAVKSRPGYRNTQFLITTGPGPVPRLDGGNLVFGRVLEGLGVVGQVAQVPTFKPSLNSQQLNVFAQSIGDDRAASVRRKYGKPLKAVIITAAGRLPLTAEEQAALQAAETASTLVATTAA